MTHEGFPLDHHQQAQSNFVVVFVNHEYHCKHAILNSNQSDNHSLSTWYNYYIACLVHDYMDAKPSIYQQATNYESLKDKELIDMPTNSIVVL